MSCFHNNYLPTFSTVVKYYGKNFGLWVKKTVQSSRLRKDSFKQLRFK